MQQEQLASALISSGAMTLIGLILVAAFSLALRTWKN